MVNVKKSDMTRSLFEEHRLLILGSTYPNYSTRHIEQVCTGGIDLDDYCLKRLHPLPRRYLEAGNRFERFDVIGVRARPHPVDTRPGSLHVEPTSIQKIDRMDSVYLRKQAFEKCKDICRSVEEAHDRRDRDRTSLAMFQPKSILGCSIARKTEQERKDWYVRERAVLAQESFELGDTPLKPLDFPEVDFKVEFECDDPRCSKPHKMRMLDWGVHELWRKLTREKDPDRVKKTLDKMNSTLDLDRYEVWLFLGNFLGTECNFGLMSYATFPRTSQLTLL